MTPGPPSGLYDRPVLVLDPGMHTAFVKRGDVDAAGRFAVTGSEDKTVRIWSMTDGTLIRTIRVPHGPGNVGKVYAVAISPDGMTIAAGGWVRATDADHEEQIYLFERTTGAMTGRLQGLPNVVGHLQFSPDGRRLAAVLGGGEGLRLYAAVADGGWQEAARDENYGNASYFVAFSADGRLATTCEDGRVRLYNADGALVKTIATPQARPFGLAFNPKDDRLAVGFVDSTAVLLYDGATLDALDGPSVEGLDNGNIGSVAWSTDGAVLYAAGMYHQDLRCPVLAWADGGAGERRSLTAGSNTVMCLRSLHSLALLVVTGDPWIGTLSVDGEASWSRSVLRMDPRGQRGNLAVSPDAMLVEFGLEQWGGTRFRFDVAALRLLPSDGTVHLFPPLQATLAVTDWVNSRDPKLNGLALMLKPYEISRCLAIQPDGGRFVLGCDWSLRCYDADGTDLWTRQVPEVVWAVNVTADGRLAVAAYGDGTLRWHRMEDGAELLALFPMLDGENWVTWTPEGIYAATPGARGVLRWHVNHGWDTAGEAIPVSAIPETHRPDVIPHVLPQLSTAGALAAAELAKIRAAVRRATGSDVAPGARLHVLTIGVSDYGAAARHLDLAFADQDARDVAAALRHSQSSLYAQVLVSELVNSEATKEAIFSELAAIRDAMTRGAGDLAFILFSGHGDLADGKFYLLPHGVSASTQAALKASALAASDLHDEVAALAAHGRVILCIDACRSGGATVPLDRSLRALLEAPNVTVFTSSAAGQNSIERADWQNGAFTEALLEAFRADTDHDGLIRISDLSRHLSDRVPALTGGSQNPEVDIRFDTRILVATMGTPAPNLG